MWRAFVMAIGLFLCIVGGECMVVDRVVIADEQATADYTTTDELSAWTTAAPVPKRRVFVPPEWAPWGLLSAGVLTVLYGSAMPKQGS